jgi:hypothetical protein
MPQASQERLREMLASLSLEQQNAVEAFIRYLQGKGTAGSSPELRSALDEFVRDHSELLRRLAQ